MDKLALYNDLPGLNRLHRTDPCGFPLSAGWVAYTYVLNKARAAIAKAEGQS